MRISDWSSDVCSSDLRKRTQQVASAYVSGDTSDFFAGWAGPIGFTAGYEFRRETGRFVYGADLGTSFNQGTESAPLVPPFVKVNELFGELIVPLLSDLPLVHKLTVEGAYRRSWYEKSVGDRKSTRLGKECVSTCRSRWSPYH